MAEEQPTTEIQIEPAADASTVEVNSSAAKTIQADKVEMRSSGAQSIDADVVEMRASNAQTIRADTVRIQQGNAAQMQAQTLAAEQSNLGLVRTTEATLADSNVFALVGDHVQAANVRSVWLVARQIEGDAKALFDPRSALALGLGLGSAIGLWSIFASLMRRSR
ncbi:MAG: hypothetical protein U0559_05940 [Anaerolineae bacterium]